MSKSNPIIRALTRAEKRNAARAAKNLFGFSTIMALGALVYFLITTARQDVYSYGAKAMINGSLWSSMTTYYPAWSSLQTQDATVICVWLAVSVVCAVLAAHEETHQRDLTSAGL